MGEFLKDNRLTRAAIAAVAVVAAFYIIRKLQNKIKEQENSVENVFSSEQITTAIKQNATISKARAAQLAPQIDLFIFFLRFFKHSFKFMTGIFTI